VPERRDPLRPEVADVSAPSPATPPPAGRHPCFHAEARGRYGRVHLPIAPGCNLRCTYCRRDHDCANECRPGVASRVLAPDEVVAAVDAALARNPSITVAGIAGPGDAFCDPDRTLDALRRVRAAHPELELCVATNGLGVAEHVGALAAAGVGFVTVTVNAVDPAVGARLHDGVSVEGATLRGEEGAALLAARQLEAIRLLREAGILVKVNTVVVPGVNDGHVVEVARRLASLGVERMNAIGVIPVAGTPLASARPPTRAELVRIRREAGRHVPQMLHCARCRADAAGRLGEPDCAGGKARLVKLDHSAAAR
jgi:nitrogen fixation protein NifB